MSGTNIEDTKKQECTDSTLKEQVDDALPVEAEKQLDENDGSPMPSSHQEEETIKKKYGGIIPKKPPLISKDHERAFFDSADWALGKQGEQKPKGPLEALRPKLQPTPHQQARSRRSAYAPADDGEDDANDHETSPKAESCTLDSGDNKTTPEDQNSHK